jgi:hypothetical protein
MKIFLGDFSAVLGREDIFTSVIGKDSLYANNNENGVKSYKLCHKQKIIKGRVLRHRSFNLLRFYK